MSVLADHDSLMIELISHTISCISESTTHGASDRGTDIVVVASGIAVLARAGPTGVAIASPISALVSVDISADRLSSDLGMADPVGTISSGVSDICVRGGLSCEAQASCGSGVWMRVDICSSTSLSSGKSTRTIPSVTISAAKLVPAQLTQVNHDGRVYEDFLLLDRSVFLSLLR